MSSRDHRDRPRDGRPRPSEGGSEAPRQGSRSQKSYRAQLDRLFDSGRIGELVSDHEKARKFVSGTTTPAGPPEVRVSSGKVMRQVGGGGTAEDDRQRESRSALGQ